MDAFADRPVVKMLVGLKGDLSASREVTEAQASQLASQLGMPYVEASSKSDDNVSEAFAALSQLVFDRMQRDGR